MNILTRNVPRQYLRNGNLNLTGEGYSSFSYGLSGMTGGYLPALPLEEGGYLVEDPVTFMQNILIQGDTKIEGNTQIDGNLNIDGKFTINGEEFTGGSNINYDDIKKYIRENISLYDLNNTVNNHSFTDDGDILMWKDSYERWMPINLQDIIDDNLSGIKTNIQDLLERVDILENELIYFEAEIENNGEDGIAIAIEQLIDNDNIQQAIVTGEFEVWTSNKYSKVYVDFTIYDYYFNNELFYVHFDFISAVGDGYVSRLIGIAEEYAREYPLWIWFPFIDSSVHKVKAKFKYKSIYNSRYETIEDEPINKINRVLNIYASGMPVLAGGGENYDSVTLNKRKDWSTLTASIEELNILDGAKITTDELNNLQGSTSNIQGQLNDIYSDLNNIYSKSDVYTKTEADNKYYEKSQVYNKDYIDNQYYTITEANNRYYTKEETKSISEELVKENYNYYFKPVIQRVTNIEGQLGDIELLLDTILGYETNEYLNETLDEIIG